MAEKPWCYGIFNADDEDCIKCEDSTRIGCKDVTKLKNEAVDFFSRGKIQEWLSKAGDDLALLTNVGNGLILDEKYNAAKEIFEHYVRKMPEDLDAHLNLGLSFYHLNNAEGALSEFEKAVKIDPNHTLAHYWLGLIHQERHDLDKAMSEFKKAVELDSSNDDFHYSLGEVFEAKGMTREALKEFRMHLKLTEPWQRRVQIEGDLKESLKNLENFGKEELRKVLQMINEMNGTIHKGSIKTILENFNAVRKGLMTIWQQVDISDNLIIKTFNELKGTAAVPSLLSNVLFLRDREKYNICVPATMTGLENLGKFKPDGSISIGENYVNFNASANRFRQEEELHPETVDWLLWKVYKLSEISKITPQMWIETTPKPVGARLEMAHIKNDSIAHLVAGRNLVLYGPPGTGKTRNVVKIAEDICGKGNFTFETGNAEWTAYDIVGGPTISGATKLRFKPGILTIAIRKCIRSLEETGRPHWLIIDELNRANLDLAFGKVFSLLDIEYRDQPIIDESELEGLEDSDAYKNLKIPPQFRILATMNTYDRAILFSLGYAFRRRFAFVEVGSPFREEYPRSYEKSEENWRREVENIRSEALKEVEREVDNWIGSALLQLPEKIGAALSKHGDFSVTTRLRALDSDIKADKLDPFNPYKFACKLADHVTKNNIVEVGYAQPVDVVKFTLTYVALAHEGEIKIAMVKALDEAVKSYFMPQIEYYLPQARRKMTLGEREEAEEAEKKLEDLEKLFLSLGLLESARKMKEVINRLKTGEVRIL